MLALLQIHLPPSPPPPPPPLTPPPCECFPRKNTDSILLSLNDDPDVYGCTGAFMASEQEVKESVQVP